MYCQKCGKQIPDNVRFCSYCGAQQAAPPEPEPQRTSPSPESQRRNPEPERQRTVQPERQRAVRPEQQRTVQPERQRTVQPERPAGAGVSAMLEEMRQKSIRRSVGSVAIGALILAAAFAGGGPMVGIVVGLPFFALFGWPMVKAFKGDYQKDVRDFLSEVGNAQEVERFWRGTSPVHGVYLSREFVYFENKQRSVMLRPWDLAWAYQHVTRHLALFIIPVGKSYCTVLRTMGGNTYELPMPKQAVLELLGAIKATLPGTVIGYSLDLEKTYKENRQAFAARWEEKVPGCMAGHSPR